MTLNIEHHLLANKFLHHQQISWPPINVAILNNLFHNATTSASTYYHTPDPSTLPPSPEPIASVSIEAKSEKRKK